MDATPEFVATISNQNQMDVKDQISGQNNSSYQR
jgi:hypothetical protein